METHEEAEIQKKLSQIAHFEKKNAYRKQFYKGTKNHRSARDIRRSYKGAFGNATDEAKAHMKQGTSMGDSS